MFSNRRISRAIRRILRRPWSLRARLLAVQAALLGFVCVGIGAGTLLAMDRFLNTQLDEQVRDAGNRSVVLFELGPPPPLSLPRPLANGWRPTDGPGPAFLDAPGQSIGMVGAVAVNGHVTEAARITADGSRERLSPQACREVESLLQQSTSTVDLDHAGGDGISAVKLARQVHPDIVVLDVMLPDVSGLEVLRQLRDLYPGLPLLLLTAKDSLEDRIAGLTAGGDDYVTKPFSLEEVVLRLRALLRRTGIAGDSGDARLIVGDLVLDEDSHEVTRDGELINLTATEFELLRFMMRNNKRVLSKHQILDRVWSYDFGGRSNVVELYISYLRKKIDTGREPMIHTLRGAGYVLKPAH
ncbi:Putative two component transcriptional regulatory protein [Mycobacteroides abscessus]|nr:Putative two component transcriptional regulatory protein [Mycobacteroides abscessus]